MAFRDPRQAAAVLYMLAATGVVAWMYNMWHSLDRISGFGGDFGGSGVGFADRLSVVASHTSQLLFTAFVYGLAVALDTWSTRSASAEPFGD